MTLQDLARKINDTSTSHGFWPTDREDALKALDSLSHAHLWEQEDLERLRTIHRYIQAQQVRNMGEMLMLAVSELAEALEEDRSTNPTLYFQWDLSAISRYLLTRPENWDSTLAEAATKAKDNHDAWLLWEASRPDSKEYEPIHRFSDQEMRLLIKANFAKPEGISVELADCIIRCLDTLQSLDLGSNTIDDIVEMKMLYNSGRPHKHGRQY